MTNHPNRNWKNRWVVSPAVYLQEYRKKHGLSQQQLADLLGVKKTRLENIEQGISPGDPLFPRALRDLEREIRREEGRL